MTDNMVQIRRVLSLKCARAKVPVSGTFELTPRCNLTCKMCYVRLTPDEMKPIGKELTLEEWIQIAQQAKDAGMLFLLLTGGEPTLRTDFIEIYKELAKMGFSISINTNGTLFTKELKETFHMYPPAQVNITLYGTCREEYLALCGNPFAYDAVLDALNWLHDKNILTHLNATITPDNVVNWEKYEKFAKDIKLELRMTNYCFPPSRRTCNKEFSRLSPEQAGEIIVLDLLYREGKTAVSKRAKQMEIPVLNSCKLDLGDPIQCMAAKSQFWMNWDGTMVPCGMLSTPKTNPIKDGFNNAWEELYKKCDEIRLCPECTTCEERMTCMNCAAVTFTETGRFDGKPEYVCKMNKAYRNALLKYSK